MSYAVKVSLSMSRKRAISNMLLQKVEIEGGHFTDFPCRKIKSTLLLPDTVCGAQRCDKATLCDESKEHVHAQLKQYINECNNLKKSVETAIFKNKVEYQAHQEQLRQIKLAERIIPFINKCIESNVAKNLNFILLEKLIASTELGLFEQLNFIDKLPFEFSLENLIGAATLGNNFAMSIYFKNNDTYSRIRLIHQSNPGLEKEFKLFAIKSDLISSLSREELTEFVPKNGTLVEKEMVDISGYNLCRYHPILNIISISRANNNFEKNLSENGLKLIYHAINGGVSSTQLLQLFDGLGFKEIKLPRVIKLNHRNGEHEKLIF